MDYSHVQDRSYCILALKGTKICFSKHHMRLSKDSHLFRVARGYIDERTLIFGWSILLKMGLPDFNSLKHS